MLLNNGSGAFGTNRLIGVRGFPSSVAVGDVDGDLDALTANYSSIFTNQSDDLDEDGDLDLVTANDGTSTGTVSIRLNQFVLSVNPGNASASGQPLILSPNPSRAASVVAVTGLRARAQVHVFDVLGRAVVMATANAAGAVWLELPVGMAPGLYGLRGGGRAACLVVE
ncbi:T9SS type A sorting domain-containing protein [Hymenobacter negativus]|uniref:T9SS type A sorting domain-containing protein n=1 Tax=Hymenobacter negativus TaxID=2795026 RepID=A0ABS3QNX9_9BACT|nr:T9SS type A sorting domain-containing protein [Hymenobacter negativus]MBO2012988.1 T9SS type A sorting domain-containing protein [Hymenobacter negativus]